MTKVKISGNSREIALTEVNFRENEITEKQAYLEFRAGSNL